MATRAIGGRLVAVILLVLAVLVAGCGSDEQFRPAPTVPTRASAGPAEKVIRGWADSLRSGDLKRASGYFAVPSVVSNGGPALKLQTRAELRRFNETLPCGARVTATKPIQDRFTLVTVELTERPGAGRCGTGTGGTARVAIRVRNAKITDWRRASDLPPVAQERA